MNRERNNISIFYEILYIIMKILSIITPIITLLFFHYMLPQKHITMQIRFSL